MTKQKPTPSPDIRPVDPAAIQAIRVLSTLNR